MSQTAEEQPDDWPASFEVYERAFVRTVLRLHGIGGSPSPMQLAKAKKVLRLHGMKAAVTTMRHLALNVDAGRGRLSQPAGVEHAFMFVRYDSVLPPDAMQVREFNEWLMTETLR
jgi:hypothetical protein